MPQGTLTFSVGTRPLRIRVATASPPAAPTGLSVTAISASQLNVSWGASAGATGYVLQRSPDGSSWSQIATPSTTSYSDTGLTAGTTYDYQVEAVGPAGHSGWSATASGMTQSSGGAGVPAAPTSLSATAGSDSTGPHVALSWNWSQGSGGIPTAFRVETSDCWTQGGENGGFRWRPVHSVPATQTSCKVYSCDAYPIGGRTLTWQFRVTAVNAAGFSGSGQNTSYSNVATLTMPVPTRPAPGAPMQVQVTAGSTTASGLYGAGTAGGTPVNISCIPADDQSLWLEWNQADDNETQFDIQWSSNNGSTWNLIPAATSSLVTRYLLAGLSNTNSYRVQVRATNEVGSSAWTELTTGPTGTTPTAVSPLSTGSVYTAVGYVPPGLWTAQKDWRLRQAYADYQSNHNLNDAAKQFAQLVACATSYASGAAAPNDVGISATLMYLATGTTSWATNVWNYEFAPGTVQQHATPQGVCAGVGFDATISSTPGSSTPGSVWATSLASNTTISNDARIVYGRVLFLTGSLAGQTVPVASYDGAGNITLGTPTVALSGTPSAGNSFQMIPYPWVTYEYGAADTLPTGSFTDVINNYHQYAGFYLDIVMLLWPWFTSTQQRQITNMLNWWADCHIAVDQTTGDPHGTGGGAEWLSTMGSHDDNLVGFSTAAVIDQCLPSNPQKGRWLNPSNWGASLDAPFCQSGSLDPTGTTSSTFGYLDKSTHRNCHARYAIIGRGGRYIIGDEYDKDDMREALSSMEIAQTVLGTDHWPEWRRLWVDWIKTVMYSVTPDYSITPLVGEYQYLQVGRWPYDRYLPFKDFISRSKQIAGAVRGHPNASYLYDWVQAWQVAQGYSADWAESYIHQDWYPNRQNWKSSWPYGRFCQGNGTLYFQNGWTPTGALYGINFYGERAVDHYHFFGSNIHIYRKNTFAYSEPVGYASHMVDGNPQTTSPMHCGLGPMWVAGVEAADTTSNNYAYAVWSTHGNYFPAYTESNATYYICSKQNSASSSVNENTNVDTFCLEGTRGAFVLPGSDSHSETILLCDRMWDINPRNLSKWLNRSGYGIASYTNNSNVVGGIPTGSVAAPPTSGAITPTTTQFSTNYTASSAIGDRVDMLTGATAGQSAYLVATAASATIASGGAGYQVGDVITALWWNTTNGGDLSVLQSGSKALASSYGFLNPATFTVTGVSGGAVTSVTVNNPGAYLAQPPTTLSTIGGHNTGTPSVSISGGGGTGATAYAIVNSSGQVADIVVSNGGSGYTSNPTVTISGGSGSGATASPVLVGGQLAGATVGASGTGYLTCVLNITWTSPWSGSPTYSVNLYPPLSQAPAAGDELTISAHSYNYRLTRYADALQALSFHAPVSPTVSGSSASWMLPQDSTQSVTVEVVYPASPTITVHDERDIAALPTYNDTDVSFGALQQGEIGYQIEVQPNSTPFPSGTAPVFSVLITAIAAYDSAYQPAFASVSSNGGEAQGVLVSRTGLADVLVMFGARLGYRVHQSGYTVSYTSSTSSQTVYLCDLDPARTNTYTLDSGSSTPLTPTAGGVATISVSGSGSHTIVFSAT